MYGMDAMLFLTTGDHFIVKVMQAVAKETQALREKEHQNLAQMIANAVAKSFGGK
jgi:hypothetical protein